MLGPVSYIEHVAWSKLFPPISPQRIQLSGQQIEGLPVGVTMHWDYRSCGQDASDDTEITFIIGHFGKALIHRAQMFLGENSSLGLVALVDRLS
jgi:hypothetical protein